ADKGLCYPPQERAIGVKLTGFGGDGSVSVQGARDAATPPAAAQQTVPPSLSTAKPSEEYRGGVDGALRTGKFWTVVGV
ncbi:hypothetical protein ACQ1Z2_16390, partial [Enterococcus faecalis]|uniref:hypothetical protein n=1 Tax=Enterococcus faecalis TaxID=1351 RepID=UPI003D6C4962